MGVVYFYCSLTGRLARYEPSSIPVANARNAPLVCDCAQQIVSGITKLVFSPTATAGTGGGEEGSPSRPQSARATQASRGRRASIGERAIGAVSALVAPLISAMRMANAEHGGRLRAHSQPGLLLRRTLESPGESPGEGATGGPPIRARASSEGSAPPRARASSEGAAGSPSGLPPLRPPAHDHRRSSHDLKMNANV